MSQVELLNPFESPAEAGGGERSSETARLVVTTIKYAAGAFLLLVVLDLLNIVKFTFLYRVDNEPLANPVRVVRNSNNKLELADGRVITNYLDNDRLAELMKRTGKDEVEITSSDLGPDLVEVYARDHQFICGTCGPILTIPVIPQRVPRYKRVTVGYGEFSSNR